MFEGDRIAQSQKESRQGFRLEARGASVKIEPLSEAKRLCRLENQPVL